MTDAPLPSRTAKVLESIAPITRFFTQSAWSRRAGEPGICDLTIGNPHQPPARAFVEALQRWTEPRDAHWYAYMQNDPGARAAAAAALRAWRGVPFEPADIFLMTGATAGLAVVLGTILEPGDEVIFISPPWFQYEGMILFAGGVPVRVRVQPETHDLDLEGLRGAITSRTRAVIVNSPHNPTGKIYPPETLDALAGILTEASARTGRTIYIVSDEAYSRIVFDGRRYHSPTWHYPHSFLVYTYTKTLLAPGERIGFVALPPQMPGREQLRRALLPMQMLLGWCFPNAVLQRALGDLERIPVDLAPLQRKRDRIVAALRGMGYAVSPPEATFYQLVRSPLADDEAFTDLLAARDVFCLPGAAMELPGWFRISLTASEEMIDRALPAFAAAIATAQGRG